VFEVEVEVGGGYGYACVGGYISRRNPFDGERVVEYAFDEEEECKVTLAVHAFISTLRSFENG
jgi:hypothetical protein